MGKTFKISLLLLEILLLKINSPSRLKSHSDSNVLKAFQENPVKKIPS
jgi:hypothetical protein